MHAVNDDLLANKVIMLIKMHCFAGEKGRLIRRSKSQEPTTSAYYYQPTLIFLYLIKSIQYPLQAYIRAVHLAFRGRNIGFKPPTKIVSSVVLDATMCYVPIYCLRL